jgi:hypothetical protein
LRAQRRLDFAQNAAMRFLNDADCAVNFSVHPALRLLVPCAPVFMGNFPPGRGGNFTIDRGDWEPMVLEAGMGAIEKEM